MASYDAKRVHCHVYTFKEGMLSALAHDLKIRVTELRAEVDHAAKTIEVTISADSLRVETVMKKGHEARDELGPDHFKKIEKAIVEDVLRAAKFPTIRFASSSVREQGARLAIEGTLELHGARKHISLAARREGDDWVAEYELHQPDYGITPYSAMMGTLRVKPHLKLVIAVPAG